MAASTSAVRRSRITVSAMKPHFATSANPESRSLRGRVSSTSRSAITATGAVNVPTRFFPSVVLMPVLPPTAASTMPSTLVGRLTKATPRSHVDATKPARSVTAPPPSPITASLRVKSAWPRIPQQNAATSMRFASSASGTSASSTSARPASRSRIASARRVCTGWWISSTFFAPAGTAASISAPRSRPMTTSYSPALRTGILTVLMPALSEHDSRKDPRQQERIALCFLLTVLLPAHVLGSSCCGAPTACSCSASSAAIRVIGRREVSTVRRRARGRSGRAPPRCRARRRCRR